MPVRPLTAAPAKKYTMPSWSVTANGGYIVFAMNRARTTFYALDVGGGAQLNRLNQSTDGGTTWSVVRNFSGYSGLSASIIVQSMVELDNGEMMIALGTSAGAVQLWKSSGFVSNPATATWALKHVCGGGQASQGNLNFYSFHDQCLGPGGQVFYSEAGGQTDVTITSRIVVTNAGSGYSSAPTVALDAASGGTPATVTATVAGGKLERLTINTPGSGQTNGTYNFTFTGGGGTGMAATYTITGGVLSGVAVVIVDGGSGYTNVTLGIPGSAGAGTGADVRAQAVAGVITRVGILNGGTGYTDGYHSFVVSGDGTGGVVQFRVASGVIVSASTGNTLRATRIYKSSDNGETFSQIYDLYADPAIKYSPGIHLHGIAYDRDWARIWALFGDGSNGQNLAGYPVNTQVVYSDDDGASWQYLAGAPIIEGQSAAAQYTGIRITQKHVILTTDTSPQSPFFVVMYPRTGYRSLGSAFLGAGAKFNLTGLGFRPSSAYTLTDEFPIWLAFSGTAIGTPAANEPCLICSPDGGDTQYEIWRENDITTRPIAQAGTIRQPLGPDTSGRFIANYNTFSAHLKGTIVTNF